MPPHPAKFSDPVLDKMKTIAEAYGITRVLDPFAGTCKIFSIAPRGSLVVALEIESEWLLGWPLPKPPQVNGNALYLPFKDNAFQACFTSPTYGNRMADKHDAQEVCKTCNGAGHYFELPPMQPLDQLKRVQGIKKTCPKCDGIGHNTYKRMTYKHQLGRELHKDNSGGLQWGPSYRSFHSAWVREIDRVVTDFIVLNIANHIRGGEEVDVAGWWKAMMWVHGWDCIEEHWINTRKMGMGANRDARVPGEMVYVFQKLHKHSSTSLGTHEDISQGEPRFGPPAKVLACLP